MRTTIEKDDVIISDPIAGRKKGYRKIKVGWVGIYRDYAYSEVSRNNPYINPPMLLLYMHYDRSGMKFWVSNEWATDVEYCSATKCINFSHANCLPMYQ